MRAVIEEVMCDEDTLEARRRARWLEKARTVETIRSLKPKGPRPQRRYGGISAKFLMIIVVAICVRLSLGIPVRKKRLVGSGVEFDVGETPVVSMSDYQSPQRDLWRRRRRHRQAGWEERLQYDETGNMPVPTAPWSIGKPMQCGTVHIEIHAGGRRFEEVPARAESGHVCDVEVDLERGQFRLSDPGRSDHDDLFGNYVHSGQDRVSGT